mmetsp:Transcript_29238/g.26654  ORF Transcript_29238/g.26654 Transcript_29238/m.26654 type:complete len:83 (-) Transcript_29238:1002-1250(-)|eukprot:CAMPEP_0114580274 /NCGR_PEP_ID=MMETSP0125-20121206/4598_1 /TAXON_ID=485358 ORGANISM="Aristerostoma sp., Strain ATCC 50986" /NCGR_SAMPLE_ID=MMETSP0125 /ASSEMBLY_ACC=CAM_ASM_000245 /LENGTH=82 /DNA_ID=CAMNT_0001771749 /DNA_START=3228 /DNA_END=3476 /DNA_ORIENTATION=-
MKVQTKDSKLLQHRNKSKTILHGNSLYVFGGDSSASSEMGDGDGKEWKSFSSYENITKSDLRSACGAISKVDLDLGVFAKGA